MQIIRRLSLIVVLLLGSCNSLAVQRVVTPVTSANSRETIEVIEWRQVGYLNSNPYSLKSISYGLCIYPLDILFSTMFAVLAPFDPDTDITWGPLGATMGILLPGITLFQGYPALSGPIGLEDAQFDEMLRAAREGRTMDALAFVKQYLPDDSLDSATIRILKRAPPVH